MSTDSTATRDDAPDASPHRLIFAHGKESGPWGTKIRHLAAVARSAGFAVSSLDYRAEPDPDRRVQQLCAQAPTARGARVLAGSSMGGYVSAMAAGPLQPDALFLIAPALYMPGYDHEPPTPPALTRVVHGWGDDIIPAGHAIRFAQTHRCALTLFDGGHTLTERLPELAELLRPLLAAAIQHAAYRQAVYAMIDGTDAVQWRIGSANEAADRWLLARGLRRRWAIVTACNPLGELADDSRNADAMQALAAALADAGLRTLAAIGHDPNGDWQPEPSLAVLDPPPGVVESLGREFEQNAIVTGELGAAPTLVWLR